MTSACRPRGGPVRAGGPPPVDDGAWRPPPSSTATSPEGSHRRAGGRRAGTTGAPVDERARLALDGDGRLLAVDGQASARRRRRRRSSITWTNPGHRRPGRSTAPGSTPPASCAAISSTLGLGPVGDPAQLGPLDRADQAPAGDGDGDRGDDHDGHGRSGTAQRGRRAPGRRRRRQASAVDAGSRPRATVWSVPTADRARRSCGGGSRRTPRRRSGRRRGRRPTPRRGARPW